MSALIEISSVEFGVGVPLIDDCFEDGCWGVVGLVPPPAQCEVIIATFGKFSNIEVKNFFGDAAGVKMIFL